MNLVIWIAAGFFAVVFLVRPLIAAWAANKLIHVAADFKQAAVKNDQFKIKAIAAHDLVLSIAEMVPAVVAGTLPLPRSKAKTDGVEQKSVVDEDLIGGWAFVHFLQIYFTLAIAANFGAPWRLWRWPISLAYALILWRISRGITSAKLCSVSDFGWIDREAIA